MKQDVFENKLTPDMMKALCDWHEKKPEVAFDSEAKILTKAGKEYKIKYAGLGAIVKAIKPILKSCGLSYSHIVTNGSVMTLLMHGESGGLLVSDRPLPDNGNPQDEGARITYQKRYQLSAMLGISTEEDTDAPPPVTQTESKPRASVAQINNAINHKEVGMLAGNKQALDTMIGKYTLDATQVRQLVYGEIQMFEDSTKEIISLLEVMGYVITKAE